MGFGNRRIKGFQNNTGHDIFKMLCVLCLPVILFGATNAQQINAVSNGKSDYVILIGEKSDEVERYAAAELQKYLAQITAQQFLIQTRAGGGKPFIAVGNHPSSKKIAVPSRYAGDDAYRLLSLGKNLFLKGATSRGTLYAVYEFLERQGCRWFTPAIPQLAGHHEFVPKKTSLTIGKLDVFERPLMKYRKRDSDLGRRSNTAQTWTPILEWAAKMRANSFSVGIGAYEEHRQQLKTEAKKRGMILQVGQHDVMNRFLSPQKYFAKNPEWFGMIDGTRTLRAKGKSVIFETANRQAMATFTANLIGYLQSRPEIDVFQLWLADAGLWSESEEAKTLGEPTERMAKFVQEVTRAIRAARLRTRVSFIAYSVYTEPPQNINFAPDTILEFCPINQNHLYSLSDSRDATNAKYYEQLKKWLAHFPGETTHYSYYAKYSWRSLPVVLPLQIAEEIKNWHALGEVGTSLYSEPGNWLALEINHAVFSKASWKENFDARKWYADYLKARFGAAANAMKSYNEFATRISLEALIPQSAADKRDERDFQDLLGEAQKAMREAVETADTPEAKWLVNKLAWQPDYLGLALKFRTAQREKNEKQANELRRQIADLIARHANDGTTLDRGYGYQAANDFGF